MFICVILLVKLDQFGSALHKSEWLMWVFFIFLSWETHLNIIFFSGINKIDEKLRSGLPVVINDPQRPEGSLMSWPSSSLAPPIGQQNHPVLGLARCPRADVCWAFWWVLHIGAGWAEFPIFTIKCFGYHDKVLYIVIHHHYYFDKDMHFTESHSFSYFLSSHENWL